MRLLGLGIESAHVVEELEDQVVADLLGRGLGLHVGQERLGVRNVHFLGNSARSELGQEGSGADRRPESAGCRGRQLRLARSRRTSAWSAGSTLRRLGARRAAMAIEWASLGSFLLERLGGEHPDPRGQGGRHIEHLFAAGHELLGQQVAHPAR